MRSSRLGLQLAANNSVRLSARCFAFTAVVRSVRVSVGLWMKWCAPKLGKRRLVRVLLNLATHRRMAEEKVEESRMTGQRKHQGAEARSPARTSSLRWLLVGVLVCVPATPSIAKAPAKISSLRFEEQGDTTIIRLRCSTKPLFSVFKLERPPRLTIDVANSRVSNVSNLTDVDTWAVSQVATSQFQTQRSTISRIMISFRRPAQYNVQMVGRELVVHIQPHESRPGSSSAAALKKRSALAVKTTTSASAQSRERVERAKRRAEMYRQRLEAMQRIAASRQAEAKRLESQLEATQLKLRKGTASTDERRRYQALSRALRKLEKESEVAKTQGRRLSTQLHLARTKIRQAEKAQAKAQQALQLKERELTSARSAQAKADAGRQRALQERAKADQARQKAERELAQVKRTVAQLRQKRIDLQAAQARAARLENALRAAKSREEAQRELVASARREMQHSRRRALVAEQERNKTLTSVKQVSARERSADRALSRLKKQVNHQQALTRNNERTMAVLRKELLAAKRQLKSKQGSSARDRARKRVAAVSAKLTKAQTELGKARKRRKDLAQQALIAERAHHRVRKQLVQSREQLARAEQSAARANRLVRQAEGRLAGQRRQLAQLLRERKSEEKKTAQARERRKDEEERLRATAAARLKAQQAHHSATAELARTRASLARLKRQEEKTLSALRTAQLKLSSYRPARSGASGRPAERPKRSVLQAKRSQARKAAPAAIRDIRFVDGQGQARIVIELSGEAQPRLSRTSDGARLDLDNVRLPKRLQRRLDTRDFGGPVTEVASFRRGSGSDVTISVGLRGDPQRRLHVLGDRLVLEVQKVAGSPAETKARFAATHSPGSATTAVDYSAVRVAGVRRRAGRGKRRGRSRRYSGRRIDLDFKDADIHNILRLLADVGNVNIITSDAVRGRVTIRMKNVPWDQALDVILRAKGLGMVREGNLLRVAPMSDLEKERESELARKKQLLLLQPLETRLIPLSYAQASGVLPKLQYMLSPRGKLTFDQRTNMVIARDVGSNLDLIERMIRNLDTQTPQVLIEARIVEARTNYSKQLGIQWGGSFSASSATGNSTGLVFPNQFGIGGGVDDPGAPTTGILLGQDGNPGFVVNMPASTGLNAGSALGLTFGSISGAFNLNLRLSAAEATGDIRIISAPKITTLDNVQAKISQGVTIPFSQVSANGVQTQFRDARLDLQVRPHVTADGSIIMRINVSRNEPDFVNTGPRGDPTILTKEANTEMLVKDGETSVIGGIYTTRDGRSWNKVPWFADIPILGWLFKNRRDTSDREEVLVFITPRIINRAQSIGQ